MTAQDKSGDTTKDAATDDTAGITTGAARAGQPGLNASFDKGKFFVSNATDDAFDGGLRDYFEYRDLGMVAATGGKVRAHVIWPTGPCEKHGDLHTHNLDFQMVYVLKCWARVHFDGVGEVGEAGAPDCCLFSLRHYHRFRRRTVYNLVVAKARGGAKVEEGARVGLFLKTQTHTQIGSREGLSTADSDSLRIVGDYHNYIRM